MHYWKFSQGNPVRRKRPDSMLDTEFETISAARLFPDDAGFPLDFRPASRNDHPKGSRPQKLN
jgi:hypothetical protein